MIYVWFTIICASILQDDDQGESVALSLLCSKNHALLEFFEEARYVNSSAHQGTIFFVQSESCEFEYLVSQSNPPTDTKNLLS